MSSTCSISTHLHDPHGPSVYRSLKTLIIWPFSVKNLRAGTIFGGHTWHWIVFDLIMSITRKRWRSRNVTQKRFRVISNIIDSRKHRSLGIGLKKLRSLRTLLGFHMCLTNGKSLKTSNIEAQIFHFDWVWYVRGLLFTDTYLNILFSNSNYWYYAVFQRSDARLTSAPSSAMSFSEKLDFSVKSGFFICVDLGCLPLSS